MKPEDIEQNKIYMYEYHTKYGAGLTQKTKEIVISKVVSKTEYVIRFDDLWAEIHQDVDTWKLESEDFHKMKNIKELKDFSEENYPEYFI